MVLPVAAKYRMASMPGFIVLETCFTALQFAIVAPLVAPAWRFGERESPSALPA